MELIDKDAVVAEIEKQGTIQPQLSWFTDKLIQIINDSVEVKEVDLENEIDDWYNTMGIPITTDALKETARHFFELGLKAQKGE